MLVGTDLCGQVVTCTLCTGKVRAVAYDHEDSLFRLLLEVTQKGTSIASVGELVSVDAFLCTVVKEP